MSIFIQLGANKQIRSPEVLRGGASTEPRSWLPSGRYTVRQNYNARASPQLSVTLAVEVRLKPGSTTRFDTISKFVRQYLEQDEQIYIPSVLEGWQPQTVLSQNVELIRVAESSAYSSCLVMTTTRAN